MTKRHIITVYTCIIVSASLVIPASVLIALGDIKSAKHTKKAERRTQMKYIHQITLIISISFGGELLSRVIPLPIPGSIYGLVALFILLVTGVIKLSQVKDVGDFLLTLMPIMFIAPIVGLIEYFEQCRDFIVPMLIVATVSTLLVMVVTGHVSQALIRHKDKKEAQRNDK